MRLEGLSAGLRQPGSLKVMKSIRLAKMGKRIQAAVSPARIGKPAGREPVAPQAVLRVAAACSACRGGMLFEPVTVVTGFFLLPIVANREKLCCLTNAERQGCINR